jgi:hypothetical protein
LGKRDVSGYQRASKYQQRRPEFQKNVVEWSIGNEKSLIAQKEDEEMASTKDVVGRHLEFFGKGDLTGILSDYAPGAVLFTPDGPLRGLTRLGRFSRR